MYRNWTELIKPRNVDFAGTNDSDYKLTFVVEPLERGFGTTLGNALRRVLISSLEGTAISSVKIDGVANAFATIPDVVEDVTEILLNLKGVVLRLEHPITQKVTLQADKMGLVTAGDIECGPDIQVMNPDHLIATLKKGGKLSMEMTVTVGKGYARAPALEVMSSIPSDEIYLDCSYNPVKRVSYKVFNARVGQQTDYDKLVFELETNGLVTPRSAVAIAAKVLREQMVAFINFDDIPIPEEQNKGAEWDMNLFRRVNHLELSVRVANCLNSFGVVYVGDLVQKNESKLLKMPNFGKKSLNELKIVLQAMDLSLGMHLEGWPPENIQEFTRQFDDENFI